MGNEANTPHKDEVLNGEIVEKDYVDNRAEITTTEKPNIPIKKSIKLVLTKGQTYYYCTCGLSANQPWCDGSHKEKPGFKPLKFVQEKDKKMKLCGCKVNKVKSGALCDKEHKKLKW